jgi:CBS-domain-containing membrane protein
MSPRAACRLEGLGFHDVYDYAPGKVDWVAAGLPTEGSEAEGPRTGDIAVRSVPTCHPHDPVSAAVADMDAVGWDSSMVLDEDGVVVGRLYRSDARDAHERALVEAIMRPGPSTFRPDVPLDELAGYMRRHEIETAPVTTGQGHLVGIALLDDIEEQLRSF